VNLLFHRGTGWRSAVRGSTNIIAGHFARSGHTVAWLGPLRHAGQPLGAGERRTLATRHDDHVIEISAYAGIPLLRRRRVPGRLRLLSARMAYQAAAPGIRDALLRHGVAAPDLIWTAGGDGGALARFFPSARIVVHCVDLYEAYAGANVIPLELADYGSADLVVAIGHSLARFLRDHRGVAPVRLRVVGQGADLELFARDLPAPAAVTAMPRPRLVWVGLLDKADAGLMAAALDALPAGAGSLILVGPEAPWARNLAAFDRRVLLCGPSGPAEAAAILKQCDIGLMLYDRARPPLQYLGQNPLKLYEMAAAGLAIVSTPHAEYGYSAPPILIASDEAEVAAQVRVALARRAQFAARSLAFAAANGWQRRFAEIETLLDGLIPRWRAPPPAAMGAPATIGTL
jgi:hypothetical protein